MRYNGCTMKTSTIKFLGMAAAVAATSAGALALETKDSSQFEYKYEMNSLPHTEDLDNSGAVDFTGGAGWTSLSNGAMIMDMTAGGKYLNSDQTNGVAGDAWRTLNATSATGGTGYTIETLQKIDSQSSGVSYVMTLQASTWDTSMYNASLNFATNVIYWGSTVLTNLDATLWHTYRVVREGGAEANKFSVYVDGALVKDGLGNGISADIKRVLLGSPGSGHKGKATVAYLRFTKGAYAPPAALTGKAAKKWSGEFPVQYEMNAGDTRFDGPNAGGTDWWGKVGTGATVSQNGNLSVTAEHADAWWRGSNEIWSASIGADTAYTVEFKLKINRRWSGTQNNRDLAFQVWAGNPRDEAVFYVGANNVYWEPNGIGTIRSLSSAINTGEWHTYRLAYSGASQSGQPYVYTLWLDDSVIGSALNGATTYNSALNGDVNFLRFGIPSSTTTGGSFDLDYVRWTTDGAWDYADPPGAFTIIFR